MKREQIDFLALVRRCADCGHRTDGTFVRPISIEVFDVAEELFEIEMEIICGVCWSRDINT